MSGNQNSTKIIHQNYVRRQAVELKMRHSLGINQLHTLSATVGRQDIYYERLRIILKISGPKVLFNASNFD